MNKSRPRLIVATILILSFGFAVPAEAQVVRSITFGEAVEIALEQNIELRRAENQLRAQSAQVTGSRAAFLPNLNLSVSPQQRYGLTFDQTAGALVQQNTQSMNANISTTLNLFNGFGDVASLRQSESQYEATDLDVRRTRQQVVFNVISLFLDVVENREIITIQEENLEAQRRQLARIEEFTRVGARPISELYQQQAQVAGIELQLLNAEQAYQISTTRIIQYLELDPFQQYAFEAPSVEDVDLTPVDHNLEALMRQAYDSRVDLRAQEFQIAATEQGIRAARSGYLPSVNLGATLSSSYSSLREFDFSDQFFNSNRAGNFGLSISVPLFDRLQTRTNVQQARIQHDNAILELQTLQQDVALEVRQAYLDYETAVKQLDVTEIQLRAAEMSLEAEQERYNVGASTLVELTQANATYVEAASDRAQAVYNFVFRSRIIDYYVGEFNPSSVAFD